MSYEAYEKMLKSVGVLVKARNFLVFQGDVEAVASKSPVEMTRLLEQICGSEDLKESIELQELKLLKIIRGWMTGTWRKVTAFFKKSVSQLKSFLGFEVDVNHKTKIKF